MKPKPGEVSLNVNEIVESLRRSTETLEPLSGDCSIYIVPPFLREPNKELFTPRVVSIGPLHHGKPELKSMEEHKRRYLCDFLDRINTGMEEYIEGLKKFEFRLHQSYVETNKYSREKFMEMMAVDGAFLMEYLLRYCCGSWQQNDRIFGRQRLIYNVKHDLLLIENQIPFFLLEYMFGLLKKSIDIDETITLVKIVQIYLRYASPWQWSETDDIVIEGREVHHLLHFLIICLQQSERKETREYKIQAAPTISELHRAGVKFKPSSTICLSTIEFSNGILAMPKLRLTNEVEQIFRNMQAFEHCHKSVYYVNNYIWIMDMLIKNEEDVKVLIRNGIIENRLEDNNAAAAVFNNLGKGNIIDSINFSYTQVIEDLNGYYNTYNTRWPEWKATLKKTYFNNPWTTISVLAAAFLLLLTITQTVCSILEVV